MKGHSFSEDIVWPVHVKDSMDVDFESLCSDPDDLATYVEFWNCPEEQPPEYTESIVLSDALGRLLGGSICRLRIEALYILPESAAGGCAG